MAKTQDEDPVQKWNELMVKWELANRNFEAATAAVTTNQSNDAQNLEFEAIQLKAMEELKELKREIDEIILQGKRKRLQIPGTLVMGTFEQSQFDRQNEEFPEKSVRLGRQQQ